MIYLKHNQGPARGLFVLQRSRGLALCRDPIERGSTPLSADGATHTARCILSTCRWGIGGARCRPYSNCQWARSERPFRPEHRRYCCKRSCFPSKK